TWVSNPSYSSARYLRGSAPKQSDARLCGPLAFACPLPICLEAVNQPCHSASGRLREPHAKREQLADPIARPANVGLAGAVEAANQAATMRGLTQLRLLYPDT